MVNRRDLLAMGIAGLACGLPRSAHALERGSFSGFPEVTLLPGRKIKLVRDFRYRDPRGTAWTVPNGYVSDGASIPQVLWSAVGGPLDGSYRDAAIIHDYFCDTMRRSWEKTHQVFFDGMISRGLSRSEATKKYWAVFYFGPRWDNAYRWTGIMRLNLESRMRWRYSATYAAVALTPEEEAARLAAEQQQLELERREFERVSLLIDQSGLGPGDVPDLRPETF